MAKERYSRFKYHQTVGELHNEIDEVLILTKFASSYKYTALQIGMSIESINRFDTLEKILNFY